ncbi:nitrate reductase molybdenum cofactor assembly chaperone [Paenibacillus macerans]|uniref:nitrate reductase molybdenum cofactor assembly chaperone n=1 Tax=Paenibacillus macerans TaxID=44252 RepID=UPI001B161182|nr:nitrate reductase molybdenum cofactor assembly chaperone [Paenibacillus macerans]MBS5910479.1 nitrate reductase molybdenum cofactor assembly chaperone [Paenibacillus macerans]GIP10713.1 nitrate reductase molybdenum cofactor assembly chaperone [Paenibacillus macerans]
MIDLVKLHEYKEMFGFFAGQLAYPDKAAFRELREAEELNCPPAVREPIAAYRERMLLLSMDDIEEQYVQTFDFEKSSTLYMTYFKYEDSRERGQMLTALKGVYELYGLEMEGRELPDYLPVMCEFLYAAQWLNQEQAETAMQTLLAVLEDGTYKLMKSLEKQDSPYFYLIKGLRETFKLCLRQEVNASELG